MRDGPEVGPGEALARIPIEGQKPETSWAVCRAWPSLFEARSPKDKGVLAELTGTVFSVKETKGKIRLQITDPDGKVGRTDPQAKRTFWCTKARWSTRAKASSTAPADPQDILRLLGIEELARYIVDEVQDVYRLRGVKINDKHIEVICARCCAVVVENVGDPSLHQRRAVRAQEILNTNDARCWPREKIPATYSNVLLVSPRYRCPLTVHLSLHPFQETTSC